MNFIKYCLKGRGFRAKVLSGFGRRSNKFGPSSGESGLISSPNVRFSSFLLLTPLNRVSVNMFVQWLGNNSQSLAEKRTQGAIVSSRGNSEKHEMLSASRRCENLLSFEQARKVKMRRPIQFSQYLLIIILLLIIIMILKIYFVIKSLSLPTVIIPS